MKAPSGGEKNLTKTQAAAYLGGVDAQEGFQWSKRGWLKATGDPLDRRRHLILVSSLDELKWQSFCKQ